MLKMRMQIALDEERVKKEGKYSLEKLWEEIDGYFKMVRWVKEILQDGSVIYSGNPNEDEHLVNSYIPYSKLIDAKWFAEYAIKFTFSESKDGVNYYGKSVLWRSRERHGISFEIK